MAADGLIHSLRDIVRRNRMKWRKRMEEKTGGWDFCVITATNERQTRGYQLQMEHRRRNGLWPADMKWMVVPDPGGKRIGSGFATVHAFRHVDQALRSDGCKRGLAGKKVLVLHCGGSSIRMPHCSAFGKVFASLPVELAPGWCSTLFDENLALLYGLAEIIQEGVMVAAGDVLLAFDPVGDMLQPDTVTALTVAVPAQRGQGHGVFVADKAGGKVQRILQKYPSQRLREAGAVDSDGNVLIDTGVFYLPPGLIATLLPELQRKGSPLADAFARGLEMDFYTDFSEALACKTAYDDYIRRGKGAGASLGPIQRMRERLWELMHERFPLSISHRDPGTFFHLGSTHDYCRALQPNSGVGRIFDFQGIVDSPSIPGSHAAALMSCTAPDSSACGCVRAGAILEKCVLWGEYKIGRGALASGLGSAGVAIKLGSRLAAFSVPLAFPDNFPVDALAERKAWVTPVYGVGDNAKLSVTDVHATFMNRSMSRWLAVRNIAPEDIWAADLPPEKRTLWTARLYPVELDSRSGRWSEWFQMPARRARALCSEWRKECRLSLEEVLEMADCERMVKGTRPRRRSGRSVENACNRVCEILRNGEDLPVADFYKDFSETAQFLRFKSSLEELALGLPCSLRRARIFKVLSDMMSGEVLSRVQRSPATPLQGHATVSPIEERAMLRLWGDAYEELAFANIRLAIEALVPAPKPSTTRRLVPGVALRVEVPARIDLGGGWSDTPPYSLEKGGAVVNIAVTLDGQCPVLAWAKTVPQPIIRLGSLDLGVTQEIANLEDMGTYNDVEDPLALLKAAVVFGGIVPRGAAGPVKAHMRRLGAGLELITECRLPKGSGMGTSSILAAAAVAALAALRGPHPGVKELFNQVLCVEQMMTTGGGWQDQVGGAVGGVKYVHTKADAPLDPQIEQMNLPPSVLDEFNERLVVYYTGRNRLAKNILRQIMGDYLSRRQPVFDTLQKIRATADELREAFKARDLNAVGRLMSQSWELNKRLTPTTSNERIDALFAIGEPYVVGGKLAGAGGGGFMALLAKDRASADRLKKILEGLAIGTEQRLHQATVDNTGLRIQVE